MKNKILLIEDDNIFQKLIKDGLSKSFEFFAAQDGEKGIKVAKDEKPDLILLDLILPKKDGFEVLEELKNDAELSHIPVVVLTNLGGAEDIEKATSLGAYTYLVKSDYTLEDLLEKVRSATQINE